MREELINALEELARINAEHELSNEHIETQIAKIEKTRVCAPVIGPFSSGKSALLNRLLGYSKRYLREDLTPETAVPTELVYSDKEGVFDTAKIIYRDERYEILPLSEFSRRAPESFRDAQSVRLSLKNDFLKNISDVMPVDMPGFGSGSDMHDRAIDDYAAQSMIYLVAFPASDMNLRADLKGILKELLGPHEIPIAVVITKCDQAPSAEQFEASLSYLRRQLDELEKHTGRIEGVYRTSSLDGHVEDVKAFFRGLQARSGELIGNRHKDAVLILAERTKTLLREIIMAGELSESELCEEEDKLNAQLERLEEKTRRATEDFERQTKSSVEEIKADVSAALEGQTGALASMVLSGGDASEHMRATVRAVLAESVKKRYTCKMEKYLDRIDAEIKLSPVFAGAGSAREADGSFADLATGALGGGLVGGLAAAGAGLAAPALGLALPAFAALPALTIGAVAIPVIGVALAGIGALIGGLMGMGKKGESKEGEVRRQLRSQVFPGILRQVGENVEAALMENTEKLGNAVEDQIAAQREALTKALAEAKALQKKESEEKEALLRKAKADLTRVDALCTRLCARLREGASHAG